MEPTYFTVIVVAAGVLCSSASVLSWQAVLCLFGAAAAINLPALGGSTVTPATLFVPFMFWRALAENGPRRLLLKVPVTVLILALVMLWGLVGAYFWPRLFSGVTQVLTLDRLADTGGAVTLTGLHPVSGNITQTAYGLGNLVTFIGARALFVNPERMRRFANAVLWVGTLNCFAAMMNLANVYLGVPPLLDFVRTGGYIMFAAYEDPAGLVRISGTFSETSAYSAFTLPIFAFTFQLWLLRVRSRFSGLVALGSLLFLAISTSGTAYVGLVLYLSCLGMLLLWRGHKSGSIPRLMAISIGMLLVVWFLGVLFAFEAPFATKLTNYLDSTVFSKLESRSGRERSSWNRQAWQNVLDTYGVGVGIGSARASSYLLVLLSNVGVVGTALFGAFLWRVLKAGPKSGPRDPIQRAAAQAVLASFLVACVSASNFDLGVLFYIFAAAASAPLALPRPERASAYAAPASSQPVSGYVRV